MDFSFMSLRLSRLRCWPPQQWAFLGIQAFIALLAFYFWRHLPVPGWAVAILAVVAAAMSIHGDMRGWQKAAWMLLIGALLVIELRAISKDRRDVEDQATLDRSSQYRAFQDVLDAERKSINTSVEGFEAEAKTANEVEQLTKNEILKITGGNSFAVVVPSVGTGGDLIPLVIKNRGDNALTGVTVTILKTWLFIRATQDDVLEGVNNRLSVGTLHAGESMIIGRSLQFSPALPNGPVPTIFIQIAAQNFSCLEVLELRKKGKNSSGTSSWEYKYKLMRLLPFHTYREGEKVKKDPVLETAQWTDAIDPNQLLLKPKQR